MRNARASCLPSRRTCRLTCGPRPFATLSGHEIYLVRKDSLRTGPFLSYWYSLSHCPDHEFDVRCLPAYDKDKDNIRGDVASDGCPLMVGRHYHFQIIGEAIAAGQDLLGPTIEARERAALELAARPPVPLDDSDIPF